jgi:archaemetzincin
LFSLNGNLSMSQRVTIFAAIAIIFFSCYDNKNTVVAIQPFDHFDTALADTIAAAIKENYNMETVVLSHTKLPAASFVNIKTPRYRADRLIEFLKEQKPDSITYVQGITEQDISTTKRNALGLVKEPTSKYADWGIFGLAYRPGPSSIVSTFRLQHDSRKKFIERLKKVALHELGHNLGLDHCESSVCVMKDAAETIKTIDTISSALCSGCKKKIQ